MKSELFLFFLGKKDGFDMQANRRFVKESQFWSPSQIKDYQNALLIPMVEHAYRNVKYYKRIFDLLGISASDIREIADLTKIPIIRKKDIIENQSDFVADNYRQYKATKHHTGGTTGIPCAYYTDRKSWAMNWALKMRTFDWAGYRYGKDRLGVMAGGSLNPNKEMSLTHRIWRNVNNYYTMPITHMDDEIMAEYAEQLREQKIRFLRGYPSAIYSFAQYLIEHNIAIPLKCVFTTAEMLFSHQRETIKKAFLCEVYDTYGCGDGMGNATECERHDGLHVCHECSIMEILDENGREVPPGEEGEVVLTSLYDYAMPLIRYAPGDRAIKLNKTCSCGRSMPLIKIIGRSSDVFRLSNGVVFNGLSLPYEELTEELNRFQIVQEAADKVVVLLETKNTFDTLKINAFRDLISKHCGEGIQVEVKVVDRIEVPVSEKFRYVISKVKK